MTKDDLVRFARRDWASVEASKAAYWVERKRVMTPDEALQVADDLRRHAQAVRPDWPSEAERAADHAAHLRLSDLLRAVRVAAR